jgi:putative Holliday junction resolvase
LTQNKRCLGIDYGDRAIGLAVSDPLLITAQGLETVRRDTAAAVKPVIKRIRELVGLYDVGTIVLGYPKNMNNTLGERAALTEAFGKRLEDSIRLPVVLWDERLSTLQAERALIETGVRREKRAKVIDEKAAVLILQGYLDYIKNTNNERKKINGQK